MYYYYIVCKNGLFYVYILNVLIATITYLFFDSTPAPYIADEPRERKGMHIPQSVVDGFNNITAIGAKLAVPVGTSFVVTKVAFALTPQQKFYLATGSAALFFAGESILRLAKIEKSNSVSEVNNKLVSFLFGRTSTPISDEANNAICSIDCLLFLTNAGFFIIYAMIVFIFLILFNLLKEDIIARLQFLWLFQTTGS